MRRGTFEFSSVNLRGYARNPPETLIGTKIVALLQRFGQVLIQGLRQSQSQESVHERQKGKDYQR